MWPPLSDIPQLMAAVVKDKGEGYRQVAKPQSEPSYLFWPPRPWPCPARRWSAAPARAGTGPGTGTGTGPLEAPCLKYHNHHSG